MSWKEEADRDLTAVRPCWKFKLPGFANEVVIRDSGNDRGFHLLYGAYEAAEQTEEPQYEEALRWAEQSLLVALDAVRAGLSAGDRRVTFPPAVDPVGAIERE